MFRLIILQQFLTDIKTRLLYVFRRVWTGYSLLWWSCMPTSRRGWNAVSHCCPLFGSFFLSFDFSHILNHLPGAPRGTSHLFHTTPYICLNQFSTSLCSFPHVFEPTKWAWLNCLIRTERTASKGKKAEACLKVTQQFVHTAHYTMQKRDHTSCHEHLSTSDCGCTRWQ